MHVFAHSTTVGISFSSTQLSGEKNFHINIWNEKFEFDKKKIRKLMHGGSICCWIESFLFLSFVQ